MISVGTISLRDESGDGGGIRNFAGCGHVRKCERRMRAGFHVTNNRFAPSARNGKCISLDGAQTKGRTRRTRGSTPVIPFYSFLLLSLSILALYRSIRFL